MRGSSLMRLSGLVAVLVLAGAGLAGGSAPAPRIKVPDGYRDWRVISVAHEEGDLNDLRIILGNDIAIAAARGGVLPYPDGSIVVRLAWRYDSLAESRQAFGRVQSYVAGPRTNGVQFMVKDATQYAATGGWGFLQVEPAGAPAPVCFGCHSIVQDRDFVFNRYAR